MFLTDEDLRALTGYVHRAKQVAQLRRMGIPFFLNAAGRPVVARAIIEGGKDGPATTAKTWEPTWAATLQ
ncbi:MAG: DUF4224 domain-containing protein [Rhodocyclaceae bacterium]